MAAQLEQQVNNAGSKQTHRDNAQRLMEVVQSAPIANGASEIGHKCAPRKQQ